MHTKFRFIAIVLFLFLTSTLAAQAREPDDHVNKALRTIERLNSSQLSKTEYCSVDSPQQNSCSESWKKWIETYSAGSPFEGFSKLSSKKLSKGLTSQLLLGDESEAKEALEKASATFNGLQIHITPMTVEQIAASFAPNQTERDRTITNNIQKNVSENKKRKDSLLIVFAGGAHIEDYFLEHSDEEIHYANYPISEDSHQLAETSIQYWREVIVVDEENIGRLKTESEELRKLPEKDQAKKKPRFSAIQQEIQTREDRISKIKTFLERRKINPARVAEMNYLKLASLRKDPRIDKNFIEKIFRNTAAPSQTILVSDVHGIDSTAPSDNLPSKECLGSLGISQITLATEGLHSKSSQDLASLKKNFIEEPYSVPNDAISNKDRLKELVESGKIQAYPNLLGLIKKMEEYESAGIKVTVVGLE